MTHSSLRDAFWLALALLRLCCASAFSLGVEPRPSEGVQPKYSVNARDSVLAELIPSRNELRQHCNPTIAILSRWHALNDGNIGDLRELLGYISGRLRCELPHWWQRQLVHAAGSQEKSGFPRNDAPPSVREGATHKLSDFELWTNRSLKVDLGSTFFRIHTAYKSVEMDYEWVSRRPHQKYASIKETDDHNQIAVALTDIAASPFRIALFEADNSKLVWEREVWGLGDPPGIVQNGPNHTLELLETDSSIIVLGTCGDCYLEEFDRTSGDCKCRFASNFWKRGR